MNDILKLSLEKKNSPRCIKKGFAVNQSVQSIIDSSTFITVTYLKGNHSQ